MDLLSKVGDVGTLFKASSAASSSASEAKKFGKSVKRSANQLVNLFTGASRPANAYKVLEDLGLPRGILPHGVKKYSLEKGKGGVMVLLVELPGWCQVEHEDKSVVRYAPEIRAVVEQETMGLVKVEGIQTKLLFWVPVTSVYVKEDVPDSVYFQVGMVLPVSRPRSAYQDPDVATFKEFEQQLK